MGNPKPRVALVTGANRGLGFETARQLLASGLSVVLAGRDAAALERARRTLSEPHQRCAIAVQMDVTSTESIAAAQPALMAQGGCVDVLVNNAAVLIGENDDLFSITADDFTSEADIATRPAEPPVHPLPAPG